MSAATESLPHCDGCRAELPNWWVARCDDCGRLYPARTKPPRQVARRIFKRDGHRCVKCGASRELTLDHIVPRSLGGTHEDDNLQTMCRPCNEAKGATLPEGMIAAASAPTGVPAACREGGLPGRG